MISMKKRITILALFFITTHSYSQEVKVVKIEELKKIYTRSNDTTYIINFFASWCGPCMMEIPVLNKFYEENKNTTNKLIYVSLDNVQYLKKMPKLITKMKMQAPVFLLNESNDFSWLPLIDKRWQGSIPATMIINHKKNVKAFFETPLEKGQLEFYLGKLGL
jgi:thiol-disulfide isomerase/thioredoxin